MNKMHFLRQNKLFLTVLLFVTGALYSAFALPGVTQSLPDASGQFVFYRDYSFERESYFGIVYFDESSVGLRYFAPAVLDSYPMQPKKDVYILFSLDPAKKHIELKGERILTTVTPEDTDLINYLHDMLYELNSRRSKAGIIDKTQTIEQEYEQFGGYVNILFNPVVPVFNIQKIFNKDGKAVFSLITAGQLTSSQDDSFAAFTGLPLKTEDDHNLSLQKKPSKLKVSYKKDEKHVQKINLDSNWEASAENLYNLSKSGVLAMDIIPSTAETVELTMQNLKRSMILGRQESYPYIESMQISEGKNGTTYTNIFYNDISKSFTKDYKIIKKLDDNSIAILTFTVFYGAYKANAKYFDKILKSYSVN